jgi:hypothetical protein
VRVRPLIEAERAEHRSVKRASELLEVSCAAYYQAGKGPSTRELSDAELRARKEARSQSYRPIVGDICQPR